MKKPNKTILLAQVNTLYKALLIFHNTNAELEKAKENLYSLKIPIQVIEFNSKVLVAIKLNHS